MERHIWTTACALAVEHPADEARIKSNVSHVALSCFVIVLGFAACRTAEMGELKELKDGVKENAGPATDKAKRFVEGGVEAVNEKDAAAKQHATDASRIKELEYQAQTLAGNLRATKEDLEAVRRNKSEVEARQARVDSIRTQLAKRIDEGALKVTVRRERLTVTLPSEVIFTPGGTELSDEGKTKVLELGFVLKNAATDDSRFVVVAHTDDQVVTNSAYKDNLEFSTARALTVIKTLELAGMKSKQLSGNGAGATDPVAPNSSANNRARNRRIEIVVFED